MTYVRAGFGDAASAAAAAGAAAAACGAYAIDLVKWNNEQKAYNAALAGRASAMATANALYQKAMKAYSGAKMGQSSGYAAATATVLAQFKNLPGAVLPKGAPACVTHKDHDTAAQACYVLSSGIKGLGSLDWSTLPACFVAALPVCSAPPTMPAPPLAIPLPTPLRPKPVAPANCSVSSSTSKTTATTTTTVPAATPYVTGYTVYPPATAPPVEEASMAETKSSAGLWIVVALATGAGAYLLLRKKKPA